MIHTYACMSYLGEILVFVSFSFVQPCITIYFLMPFSLLVDPHSFSKSTFSEY